MLKKRIIPCLDVDKGRVVKGINFLNLKDAGDPVQQAKIYSDSGADELCFLDISASNENRGILLDKVTETASSCLIPLTVGGGVRNIDDINNLLRAGADKVSINTAAVADMDFIKKSSIKFGSQCIVVAIDAKKIRPGKWEVFTHGGRKKTGLDVINYSKKIEKLGAGEILLTSMDRDGTKSGYDIELISKVSEATKIPIIASGGAGNLDHLFEGFFFGKVSAVLAASIFHFGNFSISDAKKFLFNKGVEVRI